MAISPEHRALLRESLVNALPRVKDDDFRALFTMLLVLIQEIDSLEGAWCEKLHSMAGEIRRLSNELHHSAVFFRDRAGRARQPSARSPGSGTQNREAGSDSA